MTLYTKGGIFSLAIASLVVFSAALFFLALDEGGFLDHDMLTLSMFFFAVPVLLLSGLLLTASLMAARGSKWFVMPDVNPFHRPVAGRCTHCLHDITTEDLHCPGCGRSLSNRWVPANMMSHNAHEGDKAETQRIRIELRMRRHPAAVAAARALVNLSVPPLPDPVMAVNQCLSDLQVVQNLYRSAARRLHPDRNRGEHLANWFELQDAVKTLQAFNDLVAHPDGVGGR